MLLCSFKDVGGYNDCNMDSTAKPLRGYFYVFYTLVDKCPVLLRQTEGQGWSMKNTLFTCDMDTRFASRLQKSIL